MPWWSSFQKINDKAIWNTFLGAGLSNSAFNRFTTFKNFVANFTVSILALGGGRGSMACWANALGLGFALLAPFSLSAKSIFKTDAPSIVTYFNHDETYSFLEPYRPLTRAGDNFEQPLLELIAAAQTSLDIAVQEIRLPNVAQALIRAKRERGVQVRLVIENQYNFAANDVDWAHLEAYSPHQRDRLKQLFLFLDRNQDGHLQPLEIEARDAMQVLRNAQISIVDDRSDGSQGSGLMHHKFVVVDGLYTLVTSANFTLSDFFGDWGALSTRGNSNALVVISDSRVAKSFQSEFSEMFDRHRFGLKKRTHVAQRLSLNDGSAVTVKFSPDSSRAAYELSAGGFITQTLATARKSISFLLFVFSDQKIADAMEPLFHQQNVRIRGLVESSFAFRPYSELLDLLGIRRLDARCHTERDNRPWIGPVPTELGTPTLPKGDILHHKFAVIDESVVLFGSFNWSHSANQINDETLLKIESLPVAQEFEKEVSRTFRFAKLGHSFTPDFLRQCNPTDPAEADEPDNLEDKRRLPFTL
jgi:phosphatidylserine/phosphatidylglycerophosphate/cardiolipin synthase-like enzyme